MTLVNSSAAPATYYSLGTASFGTLNPSNGYVFSFFASNANGTPRYLQFFNGTVGLGGTPSSVWLLPGGTTLVPSVLIMDSTWFSPGTFYPGRHFGTAIAWGVSSAIGTFGTVGVSAAEHFVNIRYF